MLIWARNYKKKWLLNKNSKISHCAKFCEKRLRNFTQFNLDSLDKNKMLRARSINFDHLFFLFTKLKIDISYPWLLHLCRIFWKCQLQNLYSEYFQTSFLFSSRFNQYRWMVDIGFAFYAFYLSVNKVKFGFKWKKALTQPLICY